MSETLRGWRDPQDEEDALAAACVGAAGAAGFTPEEAENCEAGALGCKWCPWAGQKEKGARAMEARANDEQDRERTLTARGANACRGYGEPAEPELVTCPKCGSTEELIVRVVDVRRWRLRQPEPGEIELGEKDVRLAEIVEVACLACGSGVAVSEDVYRDLIETAL